MAKYKRELNKSRILSFVGCVVIVLPAFLCGCNSEKDRDAATYLKLGKVDYDDGRFMNALIAYQKAIDLKPDYAEAYYSMGNAYCKLGQYEAALVAYKKCDTLEPTGKMADEARKAISELLEKDSMNKKARRIARSELLKRSQIDDSITAKLQRDRNPVEAAKARDKALLALDSTHKVDYLYRGIYWFKLSRAYGGVLSTEDEMRSSNALKLLTRQVQEMYFNACAQEGDRKYRIAFDLFERLLKMIPSMDRQDEQNEFRKNVRAHMAYINKQVGERN